MFRDCYCVFVLMLGSVNEAGLILALFLISTTGRLTNWIRCSFNTFLQFRHQKPQETWVISIATTSIHWWKHMVRSKKLLIKCYIWNKCPCFLEDSCCAIVFKRRTWHNSRWKAAPCFDQLSTETFVAAKLSYYI